MKKFGVLFMLLISLTVSAQSDFDIAKEFMSKKGKNIVDNSRAMTRGVSDKKYSIFHGDDGRGLTKIKVDNVNIIEFVADKSWASWDNANEQSVTEKTNSQQEFTEESMKRVDEIQRIMEKINKVYNAYRNGTSTGVNAIATISDYRIEGDMLFKELMSLARKNGNKEALEAFQQEKEDFDNTSYRMEQSINASMY